LKLAGISYDSTEILKDFSVPKHVDFPLISDPDSKIIRSYNVLNSEAPGMQKGMARPGFFFIDPKGVIRQKYFEVNYQNRFTPNNVMKKMLPELAEEVTAKVDAPHLGLTLAQSDHVVAPGSRVSLIAEITLPSDVQVYSPGVLRYKPLELDVVRIDDIELASQAFPKSKTLFLRAIHEKASVFAGNFRVTQDLKINSARPYSDALPSDGKAATVSGLLKYQACDATTCYLPTSVPVKWQLQVLPVDRQRVPGAIQHK
jgi:hypothetical protein